MVATVLKVATLLAASSRLVSGLALDTSSTVSITGASAAIAKSIASIYSTSQQGANSSNVGVFGGRYYWWASGAAWGALLDYRTLTGDTTYDADITKALIAQIGAGQDYLPASQAQSIGNDDQATWALACMDALEYGFPNPANVTWLQLATNVFNEQAARWDTASCNGGLRWQIYPFNVGYSYKQTDSNGGLFQLSARLARYTGNQTFTTWAGKTYDWLQQTGLVTATGDVYDGTDANMNCSEVNRLQFSRAAGFLLYGSSILYNMTGSDTWRNRTQSLSDSSTRLFFTKPDGILYEQACERVTPPTCNTDQLVLKGQYIRWLAKSTVVAPMLKPVVNTLLQSSAKAAAALCGDSGSVCKAYTWNTTASKNPSGELGPELTALSTIQSLLILNGNAGKTQLQTQNSTITNTNTSGGNGTTTGTAPGASGSKYPGAAARQVPGSIIGLGFVVCMAAIAL